MSSALEELRKRSVGDGIVRLGAYILFKCVIYTHEEFINEFVGPHLDLDDSYFENLDDEY